METTDAPSAEERYEKILEVLGEGDAKVVTDIVAARDAEIERLTKNIGAMIVMIGDSWELVQQMNTSIKSIGKTLAPLLAPQGQAQRK